MTVIKTVEPDEATGFVARSYAEDIEKLGYVASHTRAMSLNEAAAQAFVALARSTSSGLGARLYQLVTLAAAKAIGSGSCLLAHGGVARTVR